MPVKIIQNGDVLTACLEGELDHHTAKQIREEIDMSIQNNMPSMVVLDFKNLSFMDSSGIGLVMGRYKLLQQSNAELHITNTSPQIYKVMKLAGIDRLAKLNKGVIKIVE